MTRSQMRDTHCVRMWVGVPSIVAPTALVGGWSLAASRQPPSYNSARDTISALAAQSATDPWLMTLALAIVGSCYVLSAIGLVEHGGRARALLAAGGIATVLVALFPQPNAGHVPAASVGFVLLAIWPAFSVAAQWRIRIATTVALLVLLGWLAVELRAHTLLGVSERALAGAEALCPLAFLLIGYSRARRQRGDVSLS